MIRRNNKLEQQTNYVDTYAEELRKFIRKEVIVKNEFGDIFKGVCMSIGLGYLNVIIMTDTEKILIKNVSYIRRERSYKPDNEK